VPSKQDHIAKAEGNARFASSLTLDDPAKIDWALIATFYAAMHYVEAYLATMGQHVRSHTTRDGYIGRDANLKKIYNHYQDLKYYGYNARYEMTPFRASDVTGHATADLDAIRTHITPFL
jgi:hypothetical protein